MSANKCSVMAFVLETSGCTSWSQFFSHTCGRKDSCLVRMKVIINSGLQNKVTKCLTLIGLGLKHGME